MRRGGWWAGTARAALMFLVLSAGRPPDALDPADPDEHARGWLGLARAAAPARDRREMRAREAFAAGRYQDALDLYVKLYADKLHPNYLRNIGRCYQNLDEPDKAIRSFKEYLRKARRLDPGEREEIDGYIQEMEQLRQTRTAAAPPAPAPRSAPAPAPAPRSAPVPAPAPSQRVAAVEPSPQRPSPLNLQASAPPPDSAGARSPIYRRWWFWTAIGAAVLGGAAAVLLSRGGASMPSCDPGRSCL